MSDEKQESVSIRKTTCTTVLNRQFHNYDASINQKNDALTLHIHPVSQNFGSREYARSTACSHPNTAQVNTAQIRSREGPVKT